MLATVWSDTTIGGYLVPLNMLSLQNASKVHFNLEDQRIGSPDTFCISQYMLQIVKCTYPTCKPFWTNYIQYLPDRFLTPPIYCSNHRMPNSGLWLWPLSDSLPCTSFQQDCFWTRCMLWRLLTAIAEDRHKQMTIIEKHICRLCGKYQWLPCMGISKKVQAFLV